MVTSRHQLSSHRHACFSPLTSCLSPPCIAMNCMTGQAPSTQVSKPTSLPAWLPPPDEDRWLTTTSSTTYYYNMFIDITVILPISDSNTVTIVGGQCDAGDDLLVVVDGLPNVSYMTGSLSRLIQAKAVPGSVLSRLAHVNKDLITVPLELYYGHTPHRLQADPPKAAGESSSSSTSTLNTKEHPTGGHTGRGSSSATAGIVVGVVLLCGVLAAGVVYVYLKRPPLIAHTRARGCGGSQLTTTALPKPHISWWISVPLGVPRSTPAYIILTNTTYTILPLAFM